MAYSVAENGVWAQPAFFTRKKMPEQIRLRIRSVLSRLKSWNYLCDFSSFGEELFELFFATILPSLSLFELTTSSQSRSRAAKDAEAMSNVRTKNMARFITVPPKFSSNFDSL
jgi:hypothetical protein